MAKLSDYGITLDELPTVTIRGKQFPVDATMETWEYIAEIYDQDYSIFEADMNDMLKRANGKLDSRSITPSDFKIMRALIYGMLRTGGLEENPKTIERLLGMGDEVLQVYSTCMKIYAPKQFQEVDLKKSKKPQDYQVSKNQKRKSRNQNRKRNR
ncbi:hypothetical protein IGJ28_000279 [Enterococcus sp. AZ091]|uniref:hypothetical protein n=1 Tax=Enterococcus TaxID=1350 RepID=UPI002091E24C|nr:hypothetical protein [Enterococcus gallinarum]MCO5478212.1 hypothetical protein [Enterococcus gallinarum]